jgi:O-methyltransferase
VGPKSVSDLAQATGTHAPSLYRLLRATATLGIFQEIANQVFAQTPLSAFLCTDHPNSLRYVALYLLSSAQVVAWSDLAYSVQTGKPAFEHQSGTNFWQFLHTHPDEHTIFNKAMSNSQAITYDAILQEYDFSSIRSLADIGGGYGQFVMKALKRYPSMQAIIFDQPSVIEEARRFIAQSEYSERCQLQGGDFFCAVPSGMHAYFFQSVFFNWDDERYSAILRSCRQAMSTQSKILIAEPLVACTNTGFVQAFSDLQMLAILPEGARVRSVEEHQILCAEAGFRSIQVFSTSSPVSVIEVKIS